MIDHAQKVRAIEAYVAAFDAGDANAAAALFADDAIVEDPVGAALVTGIDAIRAFYSKAMQTGAKLLLDGPVRGGDRYAAFAFTVLLNFQGGEKKIEVIDTFAFNDAGKITQMRAYWAHENMHGF